MINGPEEWVAYVSDIIARLTTAHHADMRSLEKINLEVVETQRKRIAELESQLKSARAHSNELVADCMVCMRLATAEARVKELEAKNLAYTQHINSLNGWEDVK